jgi:hypothetical protein
MSSEQFLAGEPSSISTLSIKFIVPELDPPIIVPPSDPPTVPGFPGIENPNKPEVPQVDPPPPQPDISIPAPSVEDPVPPQIPPGPAYAHVQRAYKHTQKPRDIMPIQRFLDPRISINQREIN